ncbi:DNA polymerase zeta catalytic subunit isoform X2 [Sitophilus oryzae]|uniref:DNA polymerase zeta catalytic subunit n=1 Tax=Sitophilus oryzae TaxID=7048 RepID=A0A6J2XUF7_SITOR|nr:DNA polymerase zeta catalytic subunit isoform X2 [Sitophilus oryzae]
MVSVRIVVIDYYMSPPIPGLDVTYSEFRGSSVSQVPILRCFGSNEIGQKICLHIHGVFPYLYIPYDGVGNVDSLMYQLASSIDRAVNVSLNQANSSMQYVYKISLVSGIPMYGYHQKKHQFFKIYLYNPSLVSTISNLLINRNVLDRIFQPHEAHINFTLQFMIDYNLHGMSKMIISDIKYRGTTSEELYSVENIEKITLCELEGDINAGHILNQQDIISGKLAANPGIAALWEDEKQRLRNKNQSSQLGEFLELKNMKFTPTKSHLIFKQALLERLAISSTDNETAQADLDMSVYPAETPASVSLQNASIVDLHTPSSLELSLDDTFCQSQSILDTTLKPENATIDEDAQKFLLLLEELAEEKENKKELEEDSILSQTIKDADQSDESNEDILDLSMPLGSMTTPQKIVVSANANSGHTDDIEDIFNTTLIPQIDGQYDLSDNEFYQYSGVMTRSRCKKIENLKSQLPKQNPKNVCAKRSMPLLDDIFENPIELVPNFLPKAKKNSEHNISYQKELVNIEHLDKTKSLTASPSAKIRKKRNTTDSIEKTLKLISFRVNKMYARRKLNSVIKIISKKEKLFHSSYKKPKFIVKPSAKRFLDKISSYKESETCLNDSCKNNTYASIEKCQNVYINCDGAADDSSSDDEPLLNKKKRIKKNKSSTGYAPLKISAKKSPRTAEKSLPLAKQLDTINEEYINFQQTTNPTDKKYNSPASSFKRKISFDSEFPSNTTIVEEHLSCAYSPKHKTSDKLTVTSALEKVEIKEYAEDSSRSSDTTTSINHGHSDSDMFSENEDLNSSFFEKHKFNMSVAEKYDRDTHYVAKEGCSTIFTPSSFEELVENRKIDKESFSGNLMNISSKENNSQNCQDPISGESLEIKLSSEDLSQKVKTQLDVNHERVVVRSYQSNRCEIQNQKIEECHSGSQKSLESKSDNISSLESYSSTEVKSYQPINDCKRETDNNHEIISPNDAYSSNEIPSYQVINTTEIYKKALGQLSQTSSIKSEGSGSLKTEKNLEDFSRNKPVLLTPAFKPPKRSETAEYLSKNKISLVKLQEPFYSNVNDYTGVVEIGQRILKISSKASIHLQEFNSKNDSLNKYRNKFVRENNLVLNANNLVNIKLSHCKNRPIVMQPLKKPPSVREVTEWCRDQLELEKDDTPELNEELSFEQAKILIPNSPGNEENESDLSLSLSPCTPLSEDSKISPVKENKQSVEHTIDHRKKKCRRKEQNRSCEISGVTQSNSFGFDNSVRDLQAARAVIEHQYLTTMVMELHTRTRGDFKPDPEYDPICAICYSVLNDVPETHPKKSRAKGVIALNRLPISWNEPNNHLLDGVREDCDIDYADSEEMLISMFLDKIKYWDPDILAGYEIQMLSWGYLVDRGFSLSLNLIPLLGRTKINRFGKNTLKPSHFDLETDIIGRIVLDAWRLMRHEIALQSYTFESIVYHILHKRVPSYSFRSLTFWWDHRTNLFRHRVVSYYLLRVDTVLEIFQKLDFINRTSELAKLFGIMFYEVLSRGSQFRVESMMLRLAKPLNYVPVSPNVKQRAHMKAPEFIPLVMEPESKLYNDPVIVLDFQSLYPSIIIGYNYCFTTCLGRVRHLGTNVPFEFGSTQLKIPRKLTEKLSKRDLLNFAPCGVAFVKQKVREGILPRMLKEILDTRLMVKNSMKQNKGDETLQKVLHSRQLGLKLIANVTFGYTAASFSGRMSCVEIMDSIVSKARETLQRAIAMVEENTEWDGRKMACD